VGLKEVFQKAAKAGFKAAGNFVESASYSYSNNDGFGTTSNTTQTVQFMRQDFETALRAIGGQRSDTFLGEDILNTDITGVILAQECQYPIKEGAIIILSGEAYTLKKQSLDPADALYTVLLRRV